MQKPFTLMAIVIWAAAQASTANAFCSGASVAKEFRSADVVVRARLTSQMDTWDDEPSPAYNARWGGDNGLVTVYGLKVLSVFKGPTASKIEIFMPHDSGAFYVDRDKDYLLYLNHTRPYKDRPLAARGAFEVRYACGQSKPWAKVRPDDLAKLEALSGSQQPRP